MKFKIKAEENFDQEKQKLIFNATHDFFNKMESVAKYYYKLGLSKEQIMQALNESEVRFDEDEDMWTDWKDGIF